MTTVELMSANGLNNFQRAILVSLLTSAAEKEKPLAQRLAYVGDERKD